MKYIYAGDRQISCDILKFLIEKGYKPTALLVTQGKSSTHSKDLIEISGLDSENIFTGLEFKQENIINKLKQMEVDYIFGIHFPYIIPAEVLKIPKIGFINLHPSYLPFNKGWHTPSWAILEGTQYGATMHFMSEKLDEGDIIFQKAVNIELDDTANSLYGKVLALEKEVFIEAFADLLSLNPTRIKQVEKGTSHVKSDLKNIQKLDLEEFLSTKEILNRLRALTTNKVEELPYFMIDQRKIGVKIEFIELNE